MDSLLIKGATPLSGEVRVSGAKNACLPMFAAALLTDEKCVLKNVPNLSDVRFMADIVRAVGAEVSNPSDGVWEICAKNLSHIAPYELVRKMRASICLLGPLSARMKKAEVSLPGGCVIGARPVDLHIKGMRALGAKVEIERGYICVDARKMRGAQVYLGGRFGSTVTGTANIVMAAVSIPGTTVIENAACEPEIADLCAMLEKMGAIIEGAGSPTISITGVPRLCGATHSVMPDRIEAGTWITAALASRGKVLIRDAQKKYLGSFLDVLERAECPVKAKSPSSIYVDASDLKLRPIEAITLPYPGLPTDLQAQLCALMTQADGISIVTERIYPERFMHVPELARMGANIAREGPSAIISGGTKLSGAPVMASDLRASAALVIAALAASGETLIHRVYHIDRGYEKIDEKLASLGARVERLKGAE
ncbi:MAG TPA: UDP-N-acetylglucosamine 1-carboxyvinyltransferase [Candidatus Merdousia gallistercoris]|nr:UDP-N-acetylglucosamine 1-carboxyvinyltransferase [Candidatus Merdousia gallistercoris]